MTKKTLVSTLYLLSAVILLFSLSSWFFTPVAPVDEYQDLVCNQMYIDSTIGATNSYDATTYAACVSEGESFDAGDNLYKFLVSEADTFEFRFNVMDSANLYVFVMTNMIDSATGMDCPDSCLFRLDSTMNLEVVLLPGTYWLSVDGMISDSGPAQGEGSYALAIKCENVYENLECGEVISGTTANRINNYNSLDYATCFPEIEDAGELPNYSAGDVIYRIEQQQLSRLRFILENLEDSGVHMFMLDDIPNPLDGSTFPGGCFASSKTGSGSEEITAILDIGIYYLVIDGLDGAEGAFNLSMICENDYESIACGDLLMGSTSARVNYTNSADYANCSPVGNYEAGDVTYLFELEGEDEVTFTLNPTNGNDLALILAQAVLNDSTMEYSLDSCMEISDTALTGDQEQIKLMLAAGTYFIIVDGSVVNDTAEAGPYMLEVKCASLPIELISFTGASTQEGVQLDWVTASEIAFEGFHLQRSGDGIGWDNLYWQVSKGSPESMTEYRYMDKTPMNGTNFYRLRSVDLDGTVNISSIVQVNYSGKESKTEFSIYPTLASDWLNIRGVESGSTVRYEIRSPLGYLLKRGTLGQGAQTLDVSHLSSGVMYLTLTDGVRLKTLTFQKL